MTPGAFAVGATLSLLSVQEPAGDPAAAPRTDAVFVVNDRRTRQQVVVDLIGLSPRVVLTPDAFRRAERRLDELPSASRTSLIVVPRTRGFVTVKAAVTEPSILPHGLDGWGLVGGRAVLTSDLHVNVTSPARRGEVWRAMYRWKEKRPRVGLALDMPGLAGLPGVSRVDAQWERQAYGVNPATVTFTEVRRRIGFSVTDWTTGAIRWEAGTAYDHIGDHRYMSATAGVDVRWLDDRAAVVATVTRWTPLASTGAFAGGRLVLAWRSTVDQTRPAITARAEVAAVTPNAALAVWPGAGAGGGGDRNALLRAHPLFHEGILTGEIFGRRLTQGTVEYVRPVRRLRAGNIGLAAFLDVARASRRRIEANASPLHADIGGGVRVSSPTVGSQIRLDLAYGLRDHRYHFSAGFLSAWPR